MKIKKDVFAKKPWKSLDEYFAYFNKYHLVGKELETKVKQEQKKVFIPYPEIKPKKLNKQLLLDK